MEFTNIDLIGLMAATLTTLSFLPQVIKTIKTKDTKGISFLMYLSFTLGVLFWIIFGFLIDSYVIVGGNIVTFILAVTILMIKVKNIFNGTDK